MRDATKNELFEIAREIKNSDRHAREKEDSLFELLRAVCYYKDEDSTLKSARNELDLFKALAAKAGGEV